MRNEMVYRESVMKDYGGLQEPAKLHCPLGHRTLGLSNQRELRLAPT